MGSNSEHTEPSASAGFTPGPWRLELIKQWPFGIRITASNGNEILHQHAACHATGQKTRTDCELGVGFDYKPKTDFAMRREAAIEAIAEQDANAHLIAAAPDLYEALAKAVEGIRTWHNMGMPDDTAWGIYKRNAPEMKPLLDALAKAEGRS